MDKKLVFRTIVGRSGGVAVAVVLVFSLLGGVVAPHAGAYGAPEDYQVPFRCGETWYGHTYDSMRVGDRTLRGHGRGNNLAVDFNRADDFWAPVLASAAGYAWVGWSPNGFGNYIVVDHGAGYQTVYAHLAAIWIRAGQYVYQGTSIGAVGSTGASSAPHLHYEQRYNGTSQQVHFGGQAVPVAYRPNAVAVTSATGC